VAANALDIVGRQLDLAPAANAFETQRLEKLLSATGSLDELNQALCRRIAAGELTLETPGLADHLWLTTLDKLAIDQPQYATYRWILAQRAASAPSSGLLGK
jgi:hypothetical protein